MAKLLGKSAPIRPLYRRHQWSPVDIQIHLSLELLFHCLIAFNYQLDFRDVVFFNEAKSTPSTASLTISSVETEGRFSLPVNRYVSISAVDAFWTASVMIFRSSKVRSSTCSRSTPKSYNTSFFYYTRKLDYTPYLYGNTSTKTVSFVRNLYDRKKCKMTAINRIDFIRFITQLRAYHQHEGTECCISSVPQGLHIIKPKRKNGCSLYTATP